MNKFMLTAAAVFSLTASAWAQQPPASGSNPDPQRAEQMRAKHQERMQEHFRWADKDGKITQDEIKAHLGTHRTRMEKQRREQRGPEGQKS